LFADLDRIHQGSMAVLKTTGIRLCHQEILDLVKKNGIKVSGEIAFFKEDQLMHWVHKAPRSFKLYGRNPKYDMVLGGKCREYAPGYGAPKVSDYNGLKRAALFKDYIDFVKLVHQCPYFNINGGILVQPSDLDPQKSFSLMLYAALIFSDKCLIGGAGGEEEGKTVMGMLEIVFGGEELLARPRIIGLISTTSPLQISKKSLETMLAYAQYGQPLIISPGPIAGVTGPVTLAGHLVLANAEALAGIAVTQMIREGTPVVYGIQGSNGDMRICYPAAGSPDSALIVAYCARLAKNYGLPSRSGGIKNDAKSVDVQSGYESMMMMMVSCQEGINLILHSAGILDTFMAMSFEKFIVDLEIIGMVKHFLGDISFDEKRLGVDVIKKVGPGGDFLAQDHTLEFLHEEHWPAEISLHGVSAPGEKPREELKEKILNKKQKMLDAYQQPDLPSSIKTKLDNYLSGLGIYPREIIR
jgi:trimethylamine--corrinoid protein Co-methyltransferase